jgi:Putative prokaryotic signal transducing protein
VFCPQCGVQYREGVVECSDCHVPLTDGPHEPETFTGSFGDEDTQADEGAFNVLIRTGFEDPIAISLAKSLLLEAGIPFFAMDQNPAARQESGNILGWWDVRVPRDRESDAREILQSVQEMK